MIIAATSSSGLHAFATAIEPIGTVWVNAIRMTVIPLVVSLLIATIAEEKDLRTVGRIGGQAIALYVAILSALALLTFLVAPPLFTYLHIDAASAASLRGASSAAATAPALPSFTSWVVGLIPSNPVRAAVDGAMLPIIVFTVVFAGALSRVEPARRHATTAIFRGLADAMLVIVGWVLAIAPIGVFCLAVTVGVRAGIGVAGAVAFFLVVHSGLVLIGTVALYALVRIFTDVPLARFARAVLPAQIVAIEHTFVICVAPGHDRRLDAGTAPAAADIGFRAAVRRGGFSAEPGGHLDYVGAVHFETLRDPAHHGAVRLSRRVFGRDEFQHSRNPERRSVCHCAVLRVGWIAHRGNGNPLALDAIADVFKTLLNVTGQMATTVLLARGHPADGRA